MAYANHVTKQIHSYSVDSMALSLNVLFCVPFMDYLEGSYLLKNPQETIFSVVKPSFFHLELFQIYSPQMFQHFRAEYS